MNGTQEQFAHYARTILEEQVLPLLQNKGKQYTPAKGVSALLNFTDSATLFEISPQLDLMIKTNKHWHALAKWATGHRELTDQDVLERAKDIVIYMLLLSYMVEGREPIEPLDMTTLDVHTSPVYVDRSRVPPEYPDKMDPFGELGGASELSILHAAYNHVCDGFDDVKGIFFEDDGTPKEVKK